MAPEVFRGERYGAGVDIYSLGIVLYSLLNQNRMPFLPDYPQQILPNHRDDAMRRRMRGEPIPDLKGVSPSLNAIIRKACAFNREERFGCSSDMSKALQAIATAEGDELITEPNNLKLGTPSVQGNREAIPNSSSKQGETLHLLSQVFSETENDGSKGTVEGYASSQNMAGSLQDEDVSGQKEDGPSQWADDVITKQSNTKGKAPLIVMLSLAAVFILAAGLSAYLFLGLQEGYCISVNGQTEIVLSSQEEAQLTLDDLTKYYSDFAKAKSITVSSVDYEEDVDVVRVKGRSVTIMKREEALKALINGTPVNIEYISKKGETLQKIAQKYNITVEHIVSENEWINTEDPQYDESPLDDGVRIKMILIQPYLNVILDGECEIDEDIDFETETKKDNSRTLNTTEVEQEGQKGTKEVSYAFVMRNGVFTTKNPLEERVISEPINEIILQGTKITNITDAIAALPDGEATKFLWQTLQGCWTLGNEFIEFSNYGGKHMMVMGYFASDTFIVSELVDSKASGEYKAMLRFYSPGIEGGPYMSPESSSYMEIDVRAISSAKKLTINSLQEYTWGGKDVKEAESKR